MSETTTEQTEQITEVPNGQEIKLHLTENEQIALQLILATGDPLSAAAHAAATFPREMLGPLTSVVMELGAKVFPEQSEPHKDGPDVMWPTRDNPIAIWATPLGMVAKEMPIELVENLLMMGAGGSGGIIVPRR